MDRESQISAEKHQILSDAFLHSWLKVEMGWSLEKVNNGYEVKLERMGRGIEPGGVFGNMGSYWFRAHRLLGSFEELDQLEETESTELVGLGLQQMGKLATGLCDKVGLQIWLANSKSIATDTREMVLEAVFAASQKQVLERGWGIYSQEIWKDWEDTLVARGILEMQEQFIAGHGGEPSTYQLVTSNAGHGLNILKSAAAYYADRGIRVGIAAAGVPGGGRRSGS